MKSLADELLSIASASRQAMSDIQVQGSDKAIRAICSEAVTLNEGQSFWAPMKSFTRIQRSYIIERLKSKGFSVMVNSNNSLTLRW